MQTITITFPDEVDVGRLASYINAAVQDAQSDHGVEFDFDMSNWDGEPYRSGSDVRIGDPDATDRAALVVELLAYPKDKLAAAYKTLLKGAGMRADTDLMTKASVAQCMVELFGEPEIRAELAK